MQNVNCYHNVDSKGFNFDVFYSSLPIPVNSGKPSLIAIAFWNCSVSNEIKFKTAISEYTSVFVSQRHRLVKMAPNTVPKYRYEGPIDPTNPLKLDSLSRKSVIITGGTNGPAPPFSRDMFIDNY